MALESGSGLQDLESMKLDSEMVVAGQNQNFQHTVAVHALHSSESDCDSPSRTLKDNAIARY